MLVQKLRLQRGWSQEQLAEVSGLSVRTVQRLERGQPGSLETLNALAAVFEIDVARLQEPQMQTSTSSGLSPEEAHALKEVRELKAFYVHLVQYVVVIAMLAAANLIFFPGYLWFLWAAFGWGVGLFAHAMSTFNLIPVMNADWEKRQVEKRLGRKL